MADSLPDTPLDERVFRRLAKLAAFNAGHRDWQLGVLIRIGEAGHPVGVRLVVDGLMIAGAVTPIKRLADRLQAEARASIEGSDDADVLEDALTSAFAQELNDDIEERAIADELFARYPGEKAPKIDEIGLDDVDRFFRLVRGRDTFDLQDATVVLPGTTEPLAVESMRIRFDAVSAWWPLNAEIGSNVRYNRVHAGTKSDSPGR